MIVRTVLGDIAPRHLDTASAMNTFFCEKDNPLP